MSCRLKLFLFYESNNVYYIKIKILAKISVRGCLTFYQIKTYSVLSCTKFSIGTDFGIHLLKLK